MSDMFYTYDNLIVTPVDKKEQVPEFPQVSMDSSVKWLYNARENVLGLSCKSDQDFKIYFSLELSNDTDIETICNNFALFCDFMDSEYECVLSKQANIYYNGVFEVPIAANDLKPGNYGLTFYTVKKVEPPEKPEIIEDTSVRWNDKLVLGDPYGENGVSSSSGSSSGHRFPEGHIDYYWWACHHDIIDYEATWGNYVSDANDTEDSDSVEEFVQPNRPIESVLYSTNGNFYLTII